MADLRWILAMASACLVLLGAFNRVLNTYSARPRGW